MASAEEFKKKVQQIQREAGEKVNQAGNLEELEQLRVKYLGRKGIVTSLLKDLKDFDASERPALGELSNRIKNQIDQSFQKRKDELLGGQADQTKSEALFDYTLPGRKRWPGGLHPVTKVGERIIEIFYGMGFEIAKGPDVETDYYNFAALNFPEDHPARDMQDTFYVKDKILLRTHTSPVQVRVFEKRKPPIKIIAPGRCYRNEAINARSYCTFHQIEGFYVDTDVTFADLKGVLSAFVWELFGRDVRLRFRASFFPFTEPSAEVDISCFICGGKGCSVCKRSGWLEILGAGMIDPAVFEASGYDPEKYSGYAFGLGIERVAMLKYRIEDIRLFYENDLRFLKQF
jgi:phenylalanyl-tRNA synthetase alpha chain